jgi:hypothetical protein
MEQLQALIYCFNQFIAILQPFINFSIRSGPIISPFAKARTLPTPRSPGGLLIRSVLASSLKSAQKLKHLQPAPGALIRSGLPANARCGRAENARPPLGPGRQPPLYKSKYQDQSHTRISRRQYAPSSNLAPVERFSGRR